MNSNDAAVHSANKISAIATRLPTSPPSLSPLLSLLQHKRRHLRNFPVLGDGRSGSHEGRLLRCQHVGDL